MDNSVDNPLSYPSNPRELGALVKLTIFSPAKNSVFFH
ncbi:hypothetical protein YSA_02399 [Pseudomonas putida ND6]|uniref:Uncharacterized protein n=1 Tax=Pseudomonas putida ND6 TaxID=231023 RepID=I3URE5_PSEPU|nr:hypothetical protein YSA_02399 [Pseudomonas putida ND6]